MNFYKKFLESIGEKRYRIDQIDNAIYKQLVWSWEDITTLSSSLRDSLNKEFPNFMPLKVIKEQISSIDWTVKVLFETLDWKKLESVLMRHDNNRNTVCVSCQIWCPQACLFCATWKLWLVRNLSSDEIVAQVLYFARKLNNEKDYYCKEWKEDYQTMQYDEWNNENENIKQKWNILPIQRVTNIVYMWMWEPFLNYDNVMESIWFLQDQKKLWIWARHITISTSWVIPWIRRFTEENSQINLAISIHAGTDETRSKIMPVNLAYPIKDLIKSLTDYQRISNRKLFYEYIMLEWINDSINEAENLSLLIWPQISHVNIIPFNSIKENNLICASRNKMREFQEIFKKYGIPSTIRVSLWQDIDGACWQLAWN